MDIIVMQNEAYRELLKETYKYLENLFRNQQEKPNQWMDNQQLLNQLKISKRTLQNWRDQGLITFSQVGSKIYYNQKDVDAFLIKHLNKSFN